MSIYYYMLEEKFPTIKKIREYKIRKQTHLFRKFLERKKEDAIQTRDDFIERLIEFYQSERSFHKELSYTSIFAYHSSKDRLAEWQHPPYEKPLSIIDYPRYFMYRIPHFFYPRAQETFPYVPRKYTFWERFKHKSLVNTIYFFKTPCPGAIAGGVGTGLVFSAFMGIIRFLYRALPPTHIKHPSAIKKLPMNQFSFNLFILQRYISGMRGIFANAGYFVVIFGVGGLFFGCFFTPFEPQYDSYEYTWDEIRHMTVGNLASRFEATRVPKLPNYTPDAIGFMHSTLAHRTSTLLDRYHEKQKAEKNYLELERIEQLEKEEERKKRRAERKLAINHYSLMLKEDEEKK